MAESPPTQSLATTPTPPVRRRPSWTRWIVGWSLRLIVVAAILIVIITQSGVLGWLVLPRIGAALNCRAEAAQVRITSDGILVFRDLRLTVVGIDGTAATFLEVPRLEVVPRWSGLFSGSIPIDRVTARRPTIRLSQDENLRLNIESLGGKGKGQLTFIPTIDVTDAVLSFGEHGQGWYTPLISLGVEGKLTRTNPTLDRYVLELIETTPSTRTSHFTPIGLHGEFDLAAKTGSVTLDNIDLSRWQRMAVPARFNDLWSQLNIGGTISGTRFAYSPEQGPVASFDLDDVSLRIPSPEESEADRKRAALFGPPRPQTGMVQMRHVSGTISFDRVGLKCDVRGLIEDLPCAVTLATKGYELDCGFTCRIETDRFKIADNPKLLPFAPFLVKRNFARFSGPTAIVSGQVDLIRASPEVGSSSFITISGRMDFENGAAAFERFPYPFTDMRGTILFDDESVRILSITGKGPSGARMLATGRIAPPADGAEVIVDVAVTDVPIDDHLRNALPERRRPLLGMLFSEADLQKLQEMDLMKLAPSNYAFGGRSTINVRVSREYGAHAEYRTNVRVNMSQGGLLSKFFPYPIIARGFTLSMTDTLIALDAPRVEGPGGSVGNLSARVILTDPGLPDIYDVRASFTDARLDPLLLNALPAGKQSNPQSSPRALAIRLAPEGLMTCQTHVYSREDGDPGVDAVVQLSGVNARPGNQCLELRDISANLLISDEDVHVLDLQGNIGQGSFKADVYSLQIDGQSSVTHAETSFTHLSLKEPVEDLVEAVAPTQGTVLLELRQKYQPDGIVDGAVLVQSISDSVDYTARLSRIRDGSCDLFDGRLRFRNVTGNIEISKQTILCEEFVADLVFNDQETGGLRLNGLWPLDPAVAGTMEINIEDGRFESPVILALARGASPKLSDTLEQIQLRGFFHADGQLVVNPPNVPIFQGEILPQSVALVRDSAEIIFPQVEGRIRIDGGQGSFDGLRATSESWWVGFEGAWSNAPELMVDLNMQLAADGLPTDLRAILPREARSAFESAALEVRGPLLIQDGRIRYSSDHATNSQLMIDAAATFEQASFTAGTPIEASAGRAEIRVQWPIHESYSTPSIHATLNASQLSASGVAMTNGRAVIMSGESPGLYLIPEVDALIHGGRVSASASLTTGSTIGTSSASGINMYDVELQIAGADFAMLLSEFKTVEPGPDEPPLIPGSRGSLDAAFSISGVIGRTYGRRGRGAVRVAGGEVLALPGLMPMLRLSNLQAPVGETLEHASASFYLRDELITVERFDAASESMLIVGEGSILLPNMELDLRLNTQGRTSIPLFSDLFRGLRNELISTVVTGTIREPEYRIESLAGTQRMLDTLFGTNKKTPPSIEPAPHINPVVPPLQPVTPNSAPGSR